MGVAHLALHQEGVTREHSKIFLNCGPDMGALTGGTAVFWLWAERGSRGVYSTWEQQQGIVMWKKKKMLFPKSLLSEVQTGEQQEQIRGKRLQDPYRFPARLQWTDRMYFVPRDGACDMQGVEDFHPQWTPFAPIFILMAQKRNRVTQSPEST